MATVSWILALVICLSAVSWAQDDIHLPPTITHGPKRFTFYREGYGVELMCKAEGKPPPIIEWHKDGKSIDLSAIRINLKSNGNLTINPLNIRDNGTYQCFARNRYGKAMSNYSHLVRAKLSSFDDSIRDRVVMEGESFSISCQRGDSHPMPVFTWHVAKSKTDPRPKQVSVDKRVNIDPLGNLIFSHATMEDSKPELFYMCRAFNNMIGSIEQGSYTRVTVTPRPNVPLHAPKLIFSPPNNQVVGLVGSTILLQCVFSGNPTPAVSWHRLNNPQMPSGYNSEATRVMTIAEISNLRDEDEGVYVCEGTNSEGKSRQEIEVDVQAAPYFTNPADQPHNKNATQGEDVTLFCKPKAEPLPYIQWYMNGEKINPRKAGRRRQISADLESLTIHDVCKTKECGDSDIMNFQCEASNIHGSVFSDGYLNVLEKTVISVAPEDPVFKYDGSVEFKCEAKSDLATPVTIKWLKDRIEIGYVENRIWMDPDTNSLHIDTKEDQDHGKDRAGVYTCQATNEYSTAEADAVFKLPPGPVPPPKEVKQGGFTLWWVILLVALILLFLIFLLCCCICLQRNRGDTYPVDEKERKNGNDPEKELADQRMQDYQRPEDEPIKGSRASLSSTIKMESDDEGSLAEYGDLDPMNFNEEGSFIGQYNKMDKKPRRAADSTV